MLCVRCNVRSSNVTITVTAAAAAVTDFTGLFFHGYAWKIKVVHNICSIRFLCI